MKKCILCFLCLLCILGLSSCSQEELNELLFVNKIIDIIKVDDSKEDVEQQQENSVPSNNPFVSDEIENIDKDSASVNDTFINLNWLSSSNTEIDLDLMVLLVNSNGRSEQSNLINYNNFDYSEDIAVHMGDSSKGNECVYLNLDNIPEEISKIYVYCYNYSNDWDNLFSLKLNIDSLSEKYDTDIRTGSINPLDTESEFGTTYYTNNSESFDIEDSSVKGDLDTDIVDSETDTTENIVVEESPASAIQLCVYERRGPIWYLNKEMKEIVDFNSHLYTFGINTTDYSSMYLDEQARIAEEKRIAEEQARLEEEARLAEEQARLEEQNNLVGDGEIGVNDGVSDIVDNGANSGTENG